jgi:hypothetical protein
VAQAATYLPADGPESAKNIEDSVYAFSWGLSEAHKQQGFLNSCERRYSNRLEGVTREPASVTGLADVNCRNKQYQSAAAKIRPISLTNTKVEDRFQSDRNEVRRVQKKRFFHGEGHDGDCNV